MPIVIGTRPRSTSGPRRAASASSSTCGVGAPQRRWAPRPRRRRDHPSRENGQGCSFSDAQKHAPAPLEFRVAEVPRVGERHTAPVPRGVGVIHQHDGDARRGVQRAAQWRIPTRRSPTRWRWERLAARRRLPQVSRTRTCDEPDESPRAARPMRVDARTVDGRSAPATLVHGRSRQTKSGPMTTLSTVDAARRREPDWTATTRRPLRTLQDGS